MAKITIVDYANGNANSILRALHSIGAEAKFSGDPQDLGDSDFIILPGVGHAGTAIASLESKKLKVPLQDAVLARDVPVLGICLGMQLMVDHVEEGQCAGLGWVRGRTVALEVEDRVKFKVPHIGWNSVHPETDSRLSANWQGPKSFYFCHRYAVEGAEDAGRRTIFHYERPRLASFEKGNIFGVQFHPEKSHDAGQGLFRAFLSAR
jgi:imidazole glycerol-phosphate synthase subunit HisH